MSVIKSISKVHDSSRLKAYKIHRTGSTMKGLTCTEISAMVAGGFEPLPSKIASD